MGSGLGAAEGLGDAHLSYTDPTLWSTVVYCRCAHTAHYSLPSMPSAVKPRSISMRQQMQHINPRPGAAGNGRFFS